MELHWAVESGPRSQAINFTPLKAALFAATIVAAPEHSATTAPPSDGLAEVTSVIPDLIVDLRYSTAENFVHRALYPKGARCLLLKEVAERLSRAADLLRPKGFRLKVLDCYRPLSVQRELWKVLPQPAYVADPKKGSNHNRGTAVDLTLATKDGTEVEMPTPYDTFSLRAHHGSRQGSAASIANREILRQAMEAVGFGKNRSEWWHYDSPSATRFPILNHPLVTR